jgi:hypothetical protein
MAALTPEAAKNLTAMLERAQAAVTTYTWPAALTSEQKRNFGIGLLLKRFPDKPFQSLVEDYDRIPIAKQNSAIDALLEESPDPLNVTADRKAIEARKNFYRKNPIPEGNIPVINAVAVEDLRREQAFEQAFVKGAGNLRKELISRNAEIPAAAGPVIGPSQANYPALQEMLRLKEERKGLFAGLGLDEKERRKRIYKQRPDHMRNLVTREERGPSFLDGYNRAALAEIRAEDVSSPENIGHVALQQYNREKRVVRNREEEEAAAAAAAGNVAHAEANRMRDINPKTEGKRKAEWLYNALEASAEDAIYGADFPAKIEKLRETYRLAKKIKERDEAFLRAIPDAPSDALNQKIKDNLLRYLGEKAAYEAAIPTKEKQLAYVIHLKKGLEDAIRDLVAKGDADQIQTAMRNRLMSILVEVTATYAERVSKDGGRRTRKHTKGRNKKQPTKSQKMKRSTRNYRKIQ